MPDGSPRNLSVPTHVPWTGGVLGAAVDLAVKWETGLDGWLMQGLRGETVNAVEKIQRWPFLEVRLRIFPQN